MAEYIIFQTGKNVWLVDKENYNEYIKTSKDKVMRFELLDIDDETIENLFETLNQDKEEFVNILVTELDEGQTIYSN